MKSGIYRSPNGNLIYVGSDRTVRAASLSPSSWPGKRVTMREKDSECYIEGLSYRFERVGDVPYGFSFNPQQALDKYRAERAAEIDELLGPSTGESPISGVIAQMQRGEDPLLSDPARVAEKTARIAASARSGVDAFAQLGAQMANADKAVAEMHDSLIDAGFVNTHHDEYVDMKCLADERAPLVTRVYRGRMSGTAPGVSNLPRAVGKHPALGMGYGRDNLLTPAGYKRCHAQSAKKHRRQGHDVVPLGYGVYAWRNPTTHTEN